MPPSNENNNPNRMANKQEQEKSNSLKATKVTTV
jgi:hypothetical protein